MILLVMLLSIAGSGFIALNKIIFNEEKPDESRFTPVTLSEDLDEPMIFEVLNDSSVLIIERKGGLKKYDPISKSTKLIATIPVNTKYTGADGIAKEAEEGLMGLAVDPGFDKNHWIYLYYAHPTEKKHQLTRWDFIDDKLIEGSEKVMLEVKTQREVCCHTGGGMAWDPSGNLYLTVGNNTGNRIAAQTDERPGRESWDDQGHAGNTNDLRGKILRIHPEKDGTYSIPDGNLFPKGTPKTRPEIYTMGHRNPWRISIDSKTGFAYWGEVGSDASEDSEMGPKGYDELNQARKPGNFGWPYFIGNHQAFPIYDYEKDKPLAKKNPNHIINSSPNNTGLSELPPLAAPFIYYPYGVSEVFPLLGTGARSATGGPVYRRADFKHPKRPWPAYYEGKWIATDFSRGWIIAVSMDESGNYKSMERVLPGYHPIEPIDMKFGPNGDLYLLEYGSNWFRKSENSSLVRIEYNGGNRKPQIEISADKTGGKIPLKVQFSSQGSKDLDGDPIKYAWKITSNNGYIKNSNEANPLLTFTKPGVYTANLTVTDPGGLSNKKVVKLVAGNAPPSVRLNLSDNSSFYFPDKAINYGVVVSDEEDGNMLDGQIKADQVAVSIDYVQEGFDYAEVIQGQRSIDAGTQYAVAQLYINKTDCKVCHQIKTESVGPSFYNIADKYKNDKMASKRLVQKIISGGGGVWGEVVMPAHPAMSEIEAGTILNYILHIQDKTLNNRPLTGSYLPEISSKDQGRGQILIRAAYTDRGNKNLPPQTSESQVLLRNPILNPSDAQIVSKAEIKPLRMDKGWTVIPEANGYIAFQKIDLRGIRQIDFLATAQERQANIGGEIEVRLDSPNGSLIGTTKVEQTKFVMGAIATNTATAIQAAGGATPSTTPKTTTSASNGPNRLKTNIVATNGIHDVYLVFKNDKAKPKEPLLTLTSIQFRN